MYSSVSLLKCPMHKNIKNLPEAIHYDRDTYCVLNEQVPHKRGVTGPKNGNGSNLNEQ